MDRADKTDHLARLRRIGALWERLQSKIPYVRAKAEKELIKRILNDKL